MHGDNTRARSPTPGVGSLTLIAEDEIVLHAALELIEQFEWHRKPSYTVATQTATVYFPLGKELDHSITVQLRHDLQTLGSITVHMHPREETS